MTVNKDVSRAVTSDAVSSVKAAAGKETNPEIKTALETIAKAGEKLLQ